MLKNIFSVSTYNIQTKRGKFKERTANYKIIRLTEDAGDIIIKLGKGEDIDLT